MKSINKDLSKRFIEGIKNYNLTLKEIESDGWGYCGGSNDIKRFHEYFPKQELLPHKNNCVCGHDIINNCYITKNFKKFDLNCILILGSCCVKKFIPEGKKKRCINCNEPHLNRKDNFCNECRALNYDCKKIGNKWRCFLGQEYYGIIYNDVPTEYLKKFYDDDVIDIIIKRNSDKIKRYIEYRINQSNQ